MRNCLRTYLRRAVSINRQNRPGGPGCTLGTARLLTAWLLAGALWLQPVLAADAPHSTTNSMDCISCHLPHHTASMTRSNVVGNVNLCHSCHAPGGKASRYALLDSDQALAGPCLPINVTASGTSHRWDSGISGRVVYMGNARTNSSGMVYPAGDYTGRTAKAYVITVTNSGQVGTARFTWYGTQPGGGGASNVLTSGSLITLNQGVSIAFSNGLASPSFRSNDVWNLYVREDVSQPTNALLQGVLTGGLLACSLCHDQHSQTNTPFDANAPATPGASGRHFQRINNDECQLCEDCHAARAVSNANAGSHPVGVLIPNSGYFKTPSLLPLSKSSKVRCLTCHDIHNSATSDGNLLRIVNRNSLCTDCHALANTNLGVHFSSTTGVLWPGGQYGTTYPAETDSSQRGMCVQCHQPHGWPTNLNSSVDFTNLLVEATRNICITCHDGSPAAATNSVIQDFTNFTVKVSRHAVVAGDPLIKASRPVDCTDCHNPHQARVGRSVYTTTATSNRNAVVNPNFGVSGVVFNYSSLTNFTTPTTANFTLTNSVTYEYQICFKCHSSYWWGINTPPAGLSSNGTTASPVTTDLAQEFSPKNRSGHPILTGLNNYANSAAPRNIAATAMKAPWNVNAGTQTMLCTDCHNTDGALAQGPHGSAAQFMLRGPNSTNWPNVLIADIGTSWCANCHTPNALVHDSGVHSLRCYECHIVIPHGGKMSRLIADGDSTMPARYAYNSNTNLVQIKWFNKAAPASYNGNNQCNTKCTGGHTTVASGENW
ncbi:MAG: cytochrome c3 family protein [bacterium]